MKSRLERALFREKQLIGCPLDVEHNSVSMQFASLSERLDDQQIQTSLKVIPWHFTPCLLGISQG
jgi:hypothetical protein